MIDEVTNACEDMTLFEDFVIEKVNDGYSTIGFYPLTNQDSLKEYSQWKMAN